VSLHSVQKNLYRTKGWDDVRFILKRVNEMRGHFPRNRTGWKGARLNLRVDPHVNVSTSMMEHYVKFFRVFIPKGEGRFRPLGVPAMAWRIYTKMWYLPIMIFTQQ